MTESSQILVVGGGPAGSTAATLLARAGFEVTLLERDIFPRYHIGESLLPSCLEIFDLIGAREKIEAHGFQRKDGAYFAWGKDSWVLNFARLHHPYSFQVIRSEFDHLLLEHSKSQGVRVLEGTEVTRVDLEEGRPRSASWSRRDGGGTGEITFDYLIDASGRAGLMSQRYLKNRRYHESFANVALWGYWKDANRLSFAPEGAIATGALPYGWFWGIPLHDGRMSVGLVTHKTMFKQMRQELGSLDAIYHKAIAECPLIADLVRPGTLVSELATEQDYSYVAERVAAPGYLLVGDAACFIDPLLSTGVHLATHAATLATASLASILRGEVAESEALAFFEKSYHMAYLRLMVMVSGLYQLYNGKETYFWEAQRLTHHDYDDAAELNEAFLYLVSGMADLRDAARPAVGVDVLDSAGIPSDLAEQSVGMYNVYNKVSIRTSTSADTACEGLYVRTSPRLGLARADALAAGQVLG